MYILVVLCIILVTVSGNYEGFKVYSVMPSNETQIMALAVLLNSEELDFWSTLSHESKVVNIMVASDQQQSFLTYLKKHSIQHEIFIENVEQTVRQEQVKQRLAPRVLRGKISFVKYNNFEEINAYLFQLAVDYPKIVRVQSIGKTFENRDLLVIQISLNPNANNPIILIDAGIHAREWIAPAQVLYIIQQLVQNPTNRDLLEQVDWHIIPVLNPDGYEFSQTEGNRLWRKTRSRQAKNCIGTDANRNFEYYWGLTGASSNPCSDTYKGPKPFSEIETQNFKNYVLKLKKTIKLYLTFHSYGNFILYPWGYTSELPHDEYELRALANDVNDAIVAAGGSPYSIGTSTNVLYAAAGGSDDWVKGVANIELSYTIELPGGKKSGFDIPGGEILKVVNETFAGVIVYGKYISLKFLNEWNIPDNI